jgi:hypothetical protein
MAVRAAYESIFGAICARALGHIERDLVVADLAVARELSERGIFVDVILLGRGTSLAIHDALDAEAERAPAFSSHLCNYRASRARIDAELLALSRAGRVVAASGWIARSASRAQPKRISTVEPPLRSPAGLAARPHMLSGPVRVLVPGALIGRNGAHAMLECAQKLEHQIELRFSGRAADDPRALEPYRGLFALMSAPLPQLLSWADVVCAPYLIDGYSREVDLALGHRVPVIATAAAGIEPRIPGTVCIREGSAQAIEHALLAIRHPVGRGRLRADLGSLCEARSPARVEAALAQAVLG